MEDVVRNSYHNIENDDVEKSYNELMKDFNAADVILNSKWEKHGDFYEQYSLYDYSQQSMSLASS